MIRACIFDLDGTLTDTIESLTYSVGLTLKEMGLPPVTKEQCQSFVGNGAKVLMEKSIQAAGERGDARLSEAMDIYGRIFDENCTYHVTPYEGIRELLSELRGRGIKLAVLSNKPHRQTVKVAEEIFGKGAFDVARGQQEGMARKPAPDGIFAVLGELGAGKEECLYVGDSEVDIATGKNAQVKTVSVTWGFRTKEELIKAGAGNMADTPKELLRFL